MAFVYTVNKPNFSETTLLPGTCLNYRSGSLATGDFKEGNGVVVLCTPLILEIDLFELQSQEFERVVINIEDFIEGRVQLKVLTIEDGVGNEPTGAIPTDIIPPQMVAGLMAEYTDTTVTLKWENPAEDFSHVVIKRDDTVVEPTFTGETFTQNDLTADTPYFYTVQAVDVAGNVSEIAKIEFTTNVTGDTTINIATGIEEELAI